MEPKRRIATRNDNRSLKYSQNVRIALVGSLFSEAVPVMMGHAIPLLWLVMIAGQTADPWPPAVIVVSSFVWMARIVILVLAKRDQRLGGAGRLLAWAVPWAVVGLTWAATVGVQEALIIVRVHDEALRVIALALPLGIAATISARNVGTPRYGMGLLCLLLAPVQVGLILRGSLYWVVSLMLLAFIGALASIMKRNHSSTVNLLVAEQDNAQLAARLDVALENMRQGVTLFDASGVLEIVNHRFIALFSLTAGESPLGASAVELLQRCRGALIEPEDTTDVGVMSLESLAGAESGDGTLRLKNGDIISVLHKSLPGGGWLTSYEDITERRRIADKVEHMAYHDALTGVANRVKFNDQLGDCLARLKSDERLAVLFLDLDKFKPVNDLYGHATGDRLLVEVAERMVASLRKTDLVARLGGDEFAIIVSFAPGLKVIADLTQRLIENVSRPYQLGGHEVVIGTSIGVSLAPDDGADAATLLKAADQSLYNAKSQGRGRFCFSQSAVTDAVVASS